MAHSDAFIFAPSFCHMKVHASTSLGLGFELTNHNHPRPGSYPEFMFLHWIDFRSKMLWESSISSPSPNVWLWSSSSFPVLFTLAKGKPRIWTTFSKTRLSSREIMRWHSTRYVWIIWDLEKYNFWFRIGLLKVFNYQSSIFIQQHLYFFDCFGGPKLPKLPTIHSIFWTSKIFLI